MPGPKRHYNLGGKKRLRRTPCREIGLREHDWYNLHRLSDKWDLSLVDTIGLLVATNLEALHVDPLTADDLKKMGEPDPNYV